MVSNDDTVWDPPTVAGHLGAVAAGRCAVESWGAASSIGLRRETNEDRFGRRGDIFAVADGIGGHGGGVEASESALSWALGYAAALSSAAPLRDWTAMVRIANAKVRTAMQDLGHQKAGCTLTMAAVEAGRVVAVHLGDSRLYEFQAGVMTQRTVDHNLLLELEDLGSDVQQAATRGLPLNGLTSYIGKPDASLRVDAFEWLPESGSRLLLTTDGIHRYLAHDTIADVVGELPAQDAAEELTKLADAAGGRDNATAVVVQL